MIRQLKRHLTLLFTVATGATLTLILGILFLFSLRSDETQAAAYFQNQLVDLTNKLETGTSFTDSQLAETELNGRLIIHIEENGIPLFFSGAWTPQTDRNTLIELAKSKAGDLGVATAHRPFSTSMAKTGLFTLRGDHNERYRAYVLVVTYRNTFRSLTLLQDAAVLTSGKILNGLLFLALDLVGIAVLHLISRVTIKKALAPVSQYQKQQTEFVASASHELRSPLAVIQASASAITALPEQAPKMAAAIEQECTRAGKLIGDLLLLASADAGSLQADLIRSDADLVLLRLYEAYEPLCRSEGIRLLLIMPEDILPQVLTNDSYLYQILAILLDNAIAYGCSEDRAAPIVLRASCAQGYVALSIEDHGPGIPEEEKRRIFDRFYRSDKSRSRKDHFGLGLSIAQKLGEQLRIRLSAEDTVGGGTTFVVKIPY